MGDDEDRRRRGAAEDRISDLPDELLHCILLRLQSTRAAARTSLLSRRWRHVWAGLPDLLLGSQDDTQQPAATLLDSVDAALAACAAPSVVQRLDIPLYAYGLRVPACRVASWLRFASLHRVGTLYIYLPPPLEPEAEELELPVWDGATKINLTLVRHWQLRIRPAGLFMALTDLELWSAAMEGRELTALVSSQCPRLRNLTLFLTLVALSDVSVHSGSLYSLVFRVDNVRRLEVVAPKMEKLTVYDVIEAHISSPKLAELDWNGSVTYDPRRHSFADAGRHLRLLEMGPNGLAGPLLQRFDTVVLKLRPYFSSLRGIQGYTSFLNETIKLPKCETLQRHYSCPLSCRCRLQESYETDSITLGSLEEIKIDLFGITEEVQFLKQLSKCNAPILKKLVINCQNSMNDPLPSKELRKKVCKFFHPSVRVEFNGYLNKRWVCLD
ncbi:unnamed protein product [Urochloa humidicola]